MHHLTPRRPSPLELVLPALLMLACACTDLDVANPNEPDRLRVLGTPEAVAEVAHSSVNQWWRTSTDYAPYMMVEATADAVTGNCCWVRWNNTEPRVPYHNVVGSGDEYIAHRPWRDNHKALSDAADALAALDRGIAFAGDVNATESMRAAALWTVAASYMNLALLFDSAQVNVGTTEALQAPALRGYRDVRDSSLAYWNQLIALTANKSWQWPSSTLPLAAGPVTASTLNRIARTMAARTLVLSARSAEENALTNWPQVLLYADGGLTGNGVSDMDFAVVYDNDRWINFYQMYGSDHTRFRVDQRLIHRMAPNIPVTFTGLTAQPRPEPQDNRLAIANLPCNPRPEECTEGMTADFVYVEGVIGDPSRGVYMQSPFFHRRYRSVGWHVPATERMGRPMVHVLAAENDLMIAEALAWTGGNHARGAALVNKTHVTRGGRPPIGASAAQVRAGVEYERDVELYNTGGIALFDRRRVNGLQAGTLRHLPVPAAVLTQMGRSMYTHGGFP